MADSNARDVHDSGQSGSVVVMPMRSARPQVRRTSCSLSPHPAGGNTAPAKPVPRCSEGDCTVRRVTERDRKDPEGEENNSGVPHNEPVYRRDRNAIARDHAGDQLVREGSSRSSKVGGGAQTPGMYTAHLGRHGCTNWVRGVGNRSTRRWTAIATTRRPAPPTDPIRPLDQRAQRPRHPTA